VPGVHLIVKGGNHRNQIVRSAIDRRILFGGGFCGCLDEDEHPARIKKGTNNKA
jgi:hypothetical protein